MKFCIFKLNHGGSGGFMITLNIIIQTLKILVFNFNGSSTTNYHDVKCGNDHHHKEIDT